MSYKRPLIDRLMDKYEEVAYGQGDWENSRVRLVVGLVITIAILAGLTYLIFWGFTGPEQVLQEVP